MFTIPTVLFRVWMAFEWTVYFQEMRHSRNQAEGRRRGSHAGRTRIIGHCGIQIFFALGATIACVIGGQREVIWRIDSSVMLVVSCPYFERT